MSTTFVLLKSFVKPFYRQNAGFFLFLLTVMFCIVNKVDGAGLLEYHTVLVTAMLTHPFFLVFIFGCWALYARKCHQFVVVLLKEPDYSFFSILNCLEAGSRFLLFYCMQLLMLLPVFLYAFFVIYIAWQRQDYWHALIVPIYLLLLPVLTSGWQLRQLSNEARPNWRLIEKIKSFRLFPAHYPALLLKYISHEQKISFLAIKVFSCSMLYFYPVHTLPADLDISLAFLLFNFGILAHGILVMHIRFFEEMYLSFYRGMPVSARKRLLQYALVYAILLLPEILISLLLAPAHFSFANALAFPLAAYAVILLLNSLSFLQQYTIKDLFKILAVIFFVEYACLITTGIFVMIAVAMLAAVIIFMRNYSRVELGIRVSK